MNCPDGSRGALAKIIFALLFIGTVVALPRRLGWEYAVAALLPVLYVVALRARPRVVLRRIAGVEPFALGAMTLTLFQPDGWRLLVLVAVKSNLCLAVMVTLATTTPMSAILDALRRMHVPSVFVTVLALTYRYLFVLTDETTRMRRARQSRTFVKRRRFEWQSLASVAAVLFVRTSDRAERVYQAMVARGYRP
jgi:cobalt/nickel transport system permease protein